MSTTCAASRRACRAFTLAEVLAALMFMAIVIPVAVEGLRLASRAGEVGERKVTAARIADRVMNELIATGDWQPGRFSKWAQETNPPCARAARRARTMSQCGWGSEYSSAPPGFG